MDLSVRNRTIRKHQLSDSVSSSQLSYSPQSTSFDSFLDSNASDAFNRPWHRLEWGFRVNRLRKFIDQEKITHSLTEADTASLTALLLRSLKNKKLNSKTTVVYDQDEEEIKEIKGLVYHTAADGSVRAEFVEKKGAITFRRRGSAADKAARGAGTGTQGQAQD